MRYYSSTSSFGLRNVMFYLTYVYVENAWPLEIQQIGDVVYFRWYVQVPASYKSEFFFTVHRKVSK